MLALKKTLILVILLFSAISAAVVWLLLFYSTVHPESCLEEFKKSEWNVNPVYRYEYSGCISALFRSGVLSTDAEIIKLLGKPDNNYVSRVGNGLPYFMKSSKGLTFILIFRLSDNGMAINHQIVELQNPGEL